MKHYYRPSAWKKLSSRRIQSLLNSYKNSVWLPQRKSVKQQGNKRLLWLRTTPYSKRFSTVNVKTLPFYVKRVYGLSQPRSAQGRRGSWTLVSEAVYLFRCHITERSRVAGRQQKARPSTCKTSNVAHSYAKRLWLPKGTNSLWGISRKLNRASSRGLVITKTCLTSSRLVVTLMPRSAHRCLTYPTSLKKAIPILGSLRRARSWVAGTDWGGHRLRRNS